MAIGVASHDRGRALYRDRYCRDRCDFQLNCAGYDLPIDGSKWCETFTTAGLSGDGRPLFKCHMKGIYTDILVFDVNVYDYYKILIHVVILFIVSFIILRCNL